MSIPEEVGQAGQKGDKAKTSMALLKKPQKEIDAGPKFIQSLPLAESPEILGRQAASLEGGEAPVALQVEAAAAAARGLHLPGQAAGDAGEEGLLGKADMKMMSQKQQWSFSLRLRAAIISSDQPAMS
jgi:hypothetical protein